MAFINRLIKNINVRNVKDNFAPGYANKKLKRSYPKYHRCGYGTYLHHRYKHYNRYKFNNRKCNHIVAQHHTSNIDEASCDKLTVSLSMKGIRFPLQTILTALSLYFLNNSSTKAIARLMFTSFRIKISHTTIANWTKKFAPYFKNKADAFKSQLDFQSDDWHADKTVVFINGVKYYLWIAIDSETRFVLAFHLSKYRGEDSAFSLINKSKEFGEPSNLITDRWPAYNQAIKQVLPNTKHLPFKPMSSDINNNLIESFNKTFKTWYKTKKGFNSYESANNLIYMFMFHYNFIRPHGSLNNLTPAQVAGLNLSEKVKDSWLIVA